MMLPGEYYKPGAVEMQRNASAMMRPAAVQVAINATAVAEMLQRNVLKVGLMADLSR